MRVINGQVIPSNPDPTTRSTHNHFTNCTSVLNTTKSVVKVVRLGDCDVLKINCLLLAEYGQWPASKWVLFTSYMITQAFLINLTCIWGVLKIGDPPNSWFQY